MAEDAPKDMARVLQSYGCSRRRGTARMSTERVAEDRAKDTMAENGYMVKLSQWV